MKQKMALIIFILILLLGVIMPNKAFAISSSGGYIIDNYDIDMIVNEDNTFDITETIDVTFTESNKHGIFRKIPLKNVVTRLDGTKSSNRAKISNISVNEPYTTSNESGYKVLKIGDANSTVRGTRTYIIKYTYNIGKDPLKDADELYFNLIGNEWDTRIDNVNFSITMPKEFDKTQLGFSTGYRASTDSSNVSYTVTGNTIKGSTKSTLYSGEALTVRLSLPEGYFVGASINLDYTVILEIIISIIFVFIAYVLWKKYGKDDIVVDTVEFYPPDNLNSADIGFLYKGHSDQKDIISLLIYLANKGYLKIEEYEETTLKVIKSKNFKIIKLKEYDGNDENERTFFDGLFWVKEEVTKNDLYNRFYLILKEIAKNINRKENQEKVFEKASLAKRGIVIIMIVIIFLFMDGWKMLTNFGIYGPIIICAFLGITLGSVYKKPSKSTIIIASIIFLIVSAKCMIEDIIMDKIYLIKFIIEAICMVATIVFLGIMKKRTSYGNEMLGKIEGFKTFLETAEKPRLEQLVMEDPEYFYNILPYTYVLGVSNKWMKKFEDIALEAPTWYYGYTTFNMYTFNHFMNTTYASISNAMTSTPSSSHSGGSGGGFSGGGSGGGGRRLLVKNILQTNIELKFSKNISKLDKISELRCFLFNREQSFLKMVYCKSKI